MDPKDLREKASHYLALTRFIDDARTIRTLEDMARQYNRDADDQERIAQTPEQEGDDQEDTSPKPH